MWISELSERSGVPVPTVKYYLRERLLHPGEAVGATRAVYDDSHVRRLRLIRALVDIAGLGLDRVREVLAAIDDDGVDLMAKIGAAHMQLSAPPTPEPSEAARERVADLVRRRRWHTDPDASHATALAAALDTAALAGQPMSDATLDVYAAAAADVARRDLATTPRRDAEDATTYAVIGTLVNEPILISLRRMAQENLARRRLARAR
ncbi:MULTISPECIES: MerR family transcriptional regulator [unclassified Nocardioides]|uniref:MerR family transcriptional regulator n=1 Tax=unclassified Nocardioides TaxID=2615069 RepID=UPI00360E2ABF